MGRTKTIDDDALLRIARDIFRKSGHNASTREVARAAGISQAVLYQRFRTKEDLFLRAMTLEVPDVKSLLGPYPPRNAKADIRRITERVADLLASLLPTLLQVVAHTDIEDARLHAWHARLPFGPIIRGLADRLRCMQRDGLIGRVDFEAAAHALVAAAHGLAMTAAMHGGHASHHAATVRRVVDVMWQGLATRSKGD